MRAELDYCVPAGIPHSVFLGRVVGPADPQWLPDDRDKVLVWRAAQGDVCPNCRTRLSAWAEDDLAYIGQQQRCPGCEALEQERRNIPDTASGYVTAYLAPRHLVPDPAADLDEVGR